jgi:transposase
LASFREDPGDVPRERGVVVEFLSPYSPDFNPIEEYFGELKKFIQKMRHEKEDFIARAFQCFWKGASMW